MPCPQCKCKETYYFNDDDIEQNHDLERCAACGCVFDSFDAAENDDNEDL
jgi:hypothetical protein